MITIITATYNADRFLVNLLESVVPQLSKNVELVLIDGGSTDKTIEIIEQYEQHVAYWISEKDAGIYDAWNKGLRNAKGDWIMFLGADDMLRKDAIAQYEKFLDSIPNSHELHIVSSKAQMLDQSGKSIRVKGWEWKWPEFLKEMTISHPGALHSKKLFEQYGVFDISYKITGDYELLLRPRQQLKAAFMDEITVDMSEGGASDSTRAIKEHLRAAVHTGGANELSAKMNARVVLTKFLIKKLSRKAGLNVYLKK
ncbi:MAG: hypothetical protein BGO21_30530 [Dyadobacter sp. 50-39]|uniref:glycosyltransferase family 2 protein n=1 Tax=Dyadobacter sp. 50-39 TaxID=1895756 RepID=UPI00095FBC08|nr:glycosyltransferase family 2 protein [Dyadobacter sp. 50-39]OJV15909.1 MAG: hypothetical protein BGO21_30530 [Dyadobacter sp. 50-39]